MAGYVTACMTESTTVNSFWSLRLQAKDMLEVEFQPFSDAVANFSCLAGFRSEDSEQWSHLQSRLCCETSSKLLESDDSASTSWETLHHCSI